MNAFSLRSVVAGFWLLWAALAAHGAVPEFTEREPNDRPQQAQSLEFPVVLSGTIGGPMGNRDLYRLQTPAGGWDALYIELDLRGPDNVALALLDAHGLQWTKADFFGAGADEYLTSLRVPAGEYLLEVKSRRRGTKGPPSNYTLRIGPLPPLEPTAVRAALDQALDYLRDSQGEDGGVQARHGRGAVTALALQAMLGAEYTGRDDWPFVYRALDYLKGCFHPAEGITNNPQQRAMTGGALFSQARFLGYEHPIILTALVEANALGVEEDLPAMIEKGLDFSRRAQASEDRPAILKAEVDRDSPFYGGWRYNAASPNADLSVTGWHIIALISAQKAGYAVPEAVLERALGFVRRCYRRDKQTFAYMPRGGVGAGRAAMGALSMQLLGAGDAPEVARAQGYFLRHGPTWEGEVGAGFPFYYWYYATRSAVLSGDETWRLWKQAACGLLVRHQSGNGSWARNQKEMRETDPAYVTALGALMLELCDGALPIYLRTGKAPPRPAPPPRDEIAVSIEQPADGEKLALVRPVDRVMVIEFADAVRVTQGFTADRQRLNRAIDKTRAKGGTALYDAVVTAVGRLKNGPGRSAMVVLTDGKDEDRRGTRPGSRHSLEQAIAAAREAGVTVYTLGLGRGVAKEPLRRLALENAGRAYFPPSVRDLEEVYGRIGQDLKSQYNLGYSSTNRRRDGAWRRIEVQVPNTDYRVRSIDGYRAR